MNRRGLNFIRNITWKDVFAQWRNSEVWQDTWRSHWEERGFNSWKSWRTSYAAPLTPEQRIWKLYKVESLEVVKDFYGTPTRGWIAKCYGGEFSQKLATIQEHPAIANNSKITAISKRFPVITMLTGVFVDGEIYLVEGMHRANALVRMSNRGISIQSEVYIAVAELKVGELHILGKGDVGKK